MFFKNHTKKHIFLKKYHLKYTINFKIYNQKINFFFQDKDIYLLSNHNFKEDKHKLKYFLKSEYSILIDFNLKII